MSKSFDNMLHIFGCVAQGKSVEINDSVDFEDVLKASRKQSCYSVILDVLKQNSFNLSSERVEELNKESEKLFFFNFSRFCFMLEIFKRFEQQNISYVCLKGYSVGNVYANPFSRISGDIDLLVSESDEKKAIKLLCEMGYVVESYRTDFSHHDSLVHPVWGELELHLKFFEDDVSNIWFASENGELFVDKTPHLVETDKYKFYGLNTNSQLLFLFFHLAKHFISGGLSIRAMMDVALHIKKNRNDIDFESFYKVLETSGMKSFYFAMINFMVKYCCFSKEDFPDLIEVDENALNLLYEDLETGGWIGQSTQTNNLAMMTYAKEKQKTIGYDGDMTIEKSSFKNKIKIIFPTVKHLSKRYKYLRKYKFLYPLAVVSRLLSFVFKGRQNNKTFVSQEKAEENDLKRINMFKQFGLLEQDVEYKENI